MKMNYGGDAGEINRIDDDKKLYKTVSHFKSQIRELGKIATTKIH